ncbi:guanylate kinase [Candidatus Neptunochlamydia vexilliferae]|uniref:Guanylate kinase n=1 Tax=Candidatus Neptunichlamydia vexilliferae TaxID=1651774 RepID=A0ABS0AZE3_9BACT|nr:guanylate kinase [Candidatus Neptunochlamydia vexilliferae]MBF5059494.1 Guanylate kinase [Candidatus Neptunochlamydia vexilliferae]
MKGNLIIISAPAGTGKTTLVHKLVEAFPDKVVQSISCTTRGPREGEIDGKDYIFLTEEAFNERVKKGDFLEHTTVFGHQYGTLKEVVEAQRKEGKHVILVIDTQGAAALREKTDALFIFVAPPSMKVLEERLKGRKTESPEMLKKRLDWAQYEMDQAKHYAYTVVNDDLETAYKELKNIIIKEKP